MKQEILKLKNKKLIVLAASLVLVLALLLSGCATAVLKAATSTPTTDLSYKCLNPQGNATSAQRIAFTGTLLDAQAFYQKANPAEKLGNAPIAQWTDGLPVIIPTEQKVREILTGTSHKSDEVVSVYTKDSSGKYVKGSASTFQPSGWQATVEKVAVNAVMAGCKPEYLPAVLAMASGGLNFKKDTSPTGYVQIVSGTYSKEIGMNAGQGAMNGGNPPNMTIGRAFELCLINLGGALAGSTNTNQGHLFNRADLCYAEDIEALPTGWQGMNREAGLTAKESAIMLCQSSSVLLTTFAPSSFRGLNSGTGGIANKLGLVGKPGTYNFVEYLMQWSIMPGETTNGKPIVNPGTVGPQGPLCFTMHPDMANSLMKFGFATKDDFYKWVYDRTVVNMSDYKKFGWYDVLTNNGAAIEPTSNKAYNTLADDAKIHVYGAAKDQMLIVSIYPGDETCEIWSGGRGQAMIIDAWR
jgi:hypothetical protein